MFFKTDIDFAAFDAHVAKTPLLFICLNGTVEAGTVAVNTVKDHFFWEAAVGQHRDEMQAKVPAMLQSTPADVAALPSFQPQESKDYTDCFATLTACSILDGNAARARATLLDDNATEHVYQLNHVFVPAPAQTHSVKYEDRLFAVFDCWDFSQKLQLAFRSKAMCSLAGVSAEDYEEALAQGDLRHPLLASLRVRVKKGAGDRDFAALVVEASPLTLAEDDIPNGSMDALRGLLAAGGSLTPERMIAASLSDIAHSPFYNLTVQGNPVEKAFALLHFTQTTKGAQQQGTFRVVADGVVDGGDCGSHIKVGTVARCAVEQCPNFTTKKNTFAFAVICKATAPSKPAHAADLYIEAMELIDASDHQTAKALVGKLRCLASASTAGAEPSQETAYQQRKCRKLHRYPTNA